LQTGYITVEYKHCVPQLSVQEKIVEAK